MDHTGATYAFNDDGPMPDANAQMSHACSNVQGEN